MTVELYDDEPYESDGDYFYNDTYDCWEPRPEWMHPDCVDPRAAVEQGTCCKYPANVLVSRALGLAEAVDQTLSTFDRGNGDCATTGRNLAQLLETVPGLVTEVKAAIAGVNRTVAAQLLCPIGRLIHSRSCRIPRCLARSMTASSSLRPTPGPCADGATANARMSAFVRPARIPAAGIALDGLALLSKADTLVSPGLKPLPTWNTVRLEP